MCAFLAAACFWDYGSGRIPNLLLAAMAVAGWLRGLGLESFYGAVFYVTAAVLVMLVLYPFFKIGTLGSGDIKLLGVCAGYLPAQKILYFLFCSLLVAAIFSIIHFIRKGDAKERFGYLASYLTEVAQSGMWQLYFEDRESRRRAGICLSGPILCSALMHWGGIY